MAAGSLTFRSYAQPVAFVVLVIGVIVLWGVEIRNRRAVVGVVPIDKDRAAALLSGRSGQQLMRVDREDGRQWLVPLPPFRESAIKYGASAGPNEITLRVHEIGSTIQTWAFRTDDGEIAWKGADSELTLITAMAPAYVTNLADDKVLYEFHATKPQRIFAIDRATGAELWKTPILEAYFDVDPIVRAWLRPTQLVLDKPNTLAFVDRSTGAVLTTKARNWPCVLEDQVWYEPEDNSVLRFHPLSGDKETDLGSFPGTLAGQCGTFNGSVILAAEDEFRGKLLAYDATTFAPQWTVELGSFSFNTTAGRDIRASFPDSTPLNGRLSRFVPVQAIDWGLSDPKKAEPPRHAIVMLDLEKQTIAWALTHPDLEKAYLVGDGTTHWLVQGTTIAAFDGASGQLLAARTFAEDIGTVQPFHFKDGQLWLFRSHAVVSYDGRTLEPAGGWSSIESTDIRADLERRLKPR